MSARHSIVGAIFALAVSTPLAAQTTDVDFFETKIRPVLAQRCYSCHNSKMAAPKGELVLDTKEGMLKGGTSGALLVPGKPAERTCWSSRNRYIACALPTTSSAPAARSIVCSPACQLTETDW